MSNYLYNVWRDAYYKYFDRLFDYEKVYDEENGSYSEPKNNLTETNELKVTLANCNQIMQLAEKRDIILDNQVFNFLLSKINALKNNIELFAKHSGNNEEYILLCDDRKQIIIWKKQSSELLAHIQTAFLPKLFERAMEYEEKIFSDKEQIEYIKNTETINKLSSRFTDAKKKANKGRTLFTIAILVIMVIFFYLVVKSSEPNRDDFCYLVFFYLQRISIITLGIAILAFLMMLRKEYFILSQNYLHKEVLAGAFINFQEQIDKLPASVQNEKQKLNTMLLEITISELGKNPIEKLDRPISESIDLNTKSNIVSMLMEKLLKK